MPPPKKKQQYDVNIGEARMLPGTDVDIGEATELPGASDAMGFEESLGDLESMGETGEGGFAWQPVLLPDGEIGFKPRAMEAKTGANPAEHDPRLDGQRTVPFSSGGEPDRSMLPPKAPEDGNAPGHAPDIDPSKPAYEFNEPISWRLRQYEKEAPATMRTAPFSAGGRYAKDL